MADERASEIKTSKLNQEAEVAVSEGSSPNPFLSLLNGFGIFSAGVLGALYALARKDTKTAQETVDSLKNQLKDRERALVTKEKDFEARLQYDEEEWNKEREKAWVRVLVDPSQRKSILFGSESFESKIFRPNKYL